MNRWPCADCGADCFPTREDVGKTVLCSRCKAHYKDNGPCDEGKPVNSPHREHGNGPVLPDDFDFMKYL